MIPCALVMRTTGIGVPRVGGGDPGDIIMKVTKKECSPRRRG